MKQSDDSGYSRLLCSHFAHSFPLLPPLLAHAAHYYTKNPSCAHFSRVLSLLLPLLVRSPHAVGISIVQNTTLNEEEVKLIESTLASVRAKLDQLGMEEPADCWEEIEVLIPSDVDNVQMVVRYVYDYEVRVPFESWRRKRTFGERMERTGARLLSKLSSLKSVLAPFPPPPSVALGDCRCLPTLFDEDVIFDGVVTSPPYPGVYDYKEDDGAEVRLDEERSEATKTVHARTSSKPLPPSPTTAIILIPHPNPFGDSLHSSQGKLGVYVRGRMEKVTGEIERGAK